MPCILRAGGLVFFFWSDEGMEPVHVHVSKGTPSKNSLKIWLTKNGHAMVANRSNIAGLSKVELNFALHLVEGQYQYICDEWKTFFEMDEMSFYC